MLTPIGQPGASTWWTRVAVAQPTISGASMEVGPQDRIDLVRRYYASYEKDDRDALDAAVTPSFTFTSPLDDRIDRDAFFARCWPMHERITSFTLLDVCADESHALVRYLGAMNDGSEFSNAEHLEFVDDAIEHIDVFFSELE
jgi:ketosteroid isomerase-like protein